MDKKVKVIENQNKKILNNKFLSGAIILTIAGVIAKVLGAFYRVPLVSMIGSKGLGIYQLIFPIYSFFLIIISGGTSLGVSKLVSFEYEKGNKKNAVTILKSATILMFLLSIGFSLVLSMIGFPLSSFQGDRQFFYCYLALIPALIFSSQISAIKGYFQGKENMVPSGLTVIIEQALKLLFGLILANFLLSKGILFAVLGVFLGICLSEAGAFLFLIFLLFIERRKGTKKFESQSYDDSNLNIRQGIKKVFKTSLPIMLNGAILPLVYAIESCMTVWLLSKANISSIVATSLFGLEDGVVGSLINLPTVISSSISIVILPSIASSFAKKNYYECEQKAKVSLKLCYLIAIASTIAFLILSEDLVLFLYNNGLKSVLFDELKVVVDLVKISSINILYMSLLSVVTSILQGINKSYIPVRNLLISGVIKVFATIFLVSNSLTNVYGLVISDSICFIVALSLNIVSLKKYLDISFDFKNFVLKPIVCLSLMAGVIVATKFLLKNVLTSRVLTLIVIISAITIYLGNLFLTKTLRKEDFLHFSKSKKSF